MTACPYCGTPASDAIGGVCPACGAAIGTGDGAFLSRGTYLQDGKYRIESVLGQGGFGVTYAAAQINLGSRVAIKELFPEGAVRSTTRVHMQRPGRAPEFAEQRRAFLDEARTLARLRSPGVVGIQDVFEENGTAYMVMEFLEGRTLADELAVAGRLPPERVEGMARDLARTLGVVHQAQILHRDVKPENIMITRDGRNVLIDFGSARAFQASTTVRHTRLVTAGYAPLEQYASEAKYGPYTDIYALAATLHHCLTGFPPPSAPDRTTGAGLQPLPQETPNGLERAIARGLEPRVDARPEDVDAFLANLLSAPAPEAPASRFVLDEFKANDLERRRRAALGYGDDRARASSSREPMTTCPRCSAPIKKSAMYCSNCGVRTDRREARGVASEGTNAAGPDDESDVDIHPTWNVILVVVFAGVLLYLFLR